MPLSSKAFLVVALILSFSVAGDPVPGNLIVLTNDSAETPISNSADYILLDRAVGIDEISSANFDDQWLAYSGEGAFRGAKDTEVWFRFRVQQNQLKDNTWWLVLGWAMLEHAQLSVFNHDTQEWWHSRAVGNEYPMRNRYVKHRYLIFPYTFTDQAPRTFYLNVHSTNLLSIPASFWRVDDFVAHNQIDVIVVGAFFGCLLIMLMYNFSLFLFLRDKTYLYYSVYVGSVILYQLSTSGLGNLYFWDSSLWMKRYSFLYTSIFTFMSAVFFVRHFLKLPSIGGWLLWGNNLLLALWGSLALVAVVASARFLIPATSIISFITCIIAVVTAFVLWKRNVPAAKIFAISWAALVLSTIVLILSLQGVLPLNGFTRYSQMFGFVAELVLLSIALAYRINYEIEERDYAQSEALLLTVRVSEERRERLKAQKETLNIQRQLNEELEHHVVERTEQLNDAMSKLEVANAELTKLSVTDPLTKVHNRRYFDDTFIDEYKRALRTQQSLGVIVVDVDHFKNINDTYGHIVGDHCIAVVADALKKVINRPGDLVARYGGEEFVYILPGSDEEDALVVANHSRRAIEQLDFTVDNQRIRLTVSAGVAAWVPSTEGAYKQLINAADMALYRAKGAGRNCVKTASERSKLAQI